MMKSFWADLKYARRALLGAPVFTGVERVILRPLP